MHWGGLGLFLGKLRVAVAEAFETTAVFSIKTIDARA